MRSMLLTPLAMGLGATVLAGACGSGGAGNGTLCEPSSEIFCRCRGGTPGTKTCLPDGMGFGECYALTGKCEEISGGTGSTGATTTGPAGKNMYEPCDKGVECASGSCVFGYCTIECATWQECHDDELSLYGDCVRPSETLQVCVPYCGAQQDCDPYGSPSQCAWMPAVDSFHVTVCVDIPGLAPLPPDGTPCQSDWDCHLGHAGRQRVCEFDQCLGGCHEKDDCPEGASCQPGTPGSCS